MDNGPAGKYVDNRWIIHWVGLRENLNRKPWFLPSNIGLSCKLSHHPILWIMVDNGYSICLLNMVI